jgi:SH3-like domain-containing protein
MTALLLCLSTAFAGLGMPARATDSVPAAAPADAPVTAVTNRAEGPVTRLPLPRFVSIKSDKVFARRGPSQTHRIDWIYRQSGLPVEIVAEHGHWRRIRDRDGEGGWVHYALLSGNRTVIVDRDMLELRTRPSEDMPVVARLETGVIARLDDCTPTWCRLVAGGHKGWAPKSAVWGVGPAEIRD